MLDGPVPYRFGVEGNKKRQADYIAPLRPPTLAAFRPWGGSAGAGRVRPAGRKDNNYSNTNHFAKLIRMVRVNMRLTGAAYPNQSFIPILWFIAKHSRI